MVAQREVKIRFSLDGEQAYKQAIQDINSQQKLMRSEMAALESQFKGNANSTEALSSKVELLGRMYDTQKDKLKQYQEALEAANRAKAEFGSQINQYQSEISAAEKQLEELRGTTEDTSEAEAELEARITELNQKLTEAQAYYDGANRKTEEYATKANYAQVELNNLNGELQDNKGYLEEAKNSADGTASSLDAFGNKVQEAGESVSDLTQALTAAGIIKGLQELANLLGTAINASIEFEAAMAGVARTVGGTEEELARMSDEIKALSTTIPITTKELAAIAETAGQLGIAKDSVIDFTEVMAMLGTATDLTAENAATMLAQFANITGLNPEDYDRLGATVAELGDATATTASRVVDMAQGMAAAASQAGFAETDILALAASIGSLGIESAAGSTAMSTLIQTLDKAVETGNKLEDFASVANMTAQEFKRAWGEDAVSALDAFISGLNDTERNGKSAIVLLNELGINNVRQTRAILGLAEAEGLLAGTIEQANAAWDANTALQDKAEVMYGTLEAKLQLLDNSVNLVATSVGDIFTPALAEIADVAAAAGVSLAEFIDDNHEIVAAVIGAVAGLATLVAGITAVHLAATIVGPAIAAFTAALGGTPFGLIAIAVAGVGAAIGAIAVAASEAEQTLDGFVRSLEDAREVRENSQSEWEAEAASVRALVNEITKLAGAEQLSAAETQILQSSIEQLNGIVPELNLAWDSQTESLNLSVEAIESYVEAALMEQEIAQIVEGIIEIRNSQREAEEKLAEAKENLADATAALDDIEQQVANGETMVQGWEDATLAVIEAAESVETLEQEIATLEDEEDSLKQSVDELSASLEEQAAASEAAAGSMDAVAAALESLESEYEDAKEAARKSIEGQFSLFDKIEQKSKITAAEIIGNLQSQIDFYASYQENFDSLTGRNIDGIELLAAAFGDGSLESAAALAGLSTATDGEITEIIEKMKEVERSEDVLVDGIGKGVAGYEKKLAEIEDITENEVNNAQTVLNNSVPGFETAGYQLSAGTGSGISRGASLAINAAIRMAQQALQAAKRELDIRSPSRKMEEVGRFFDLGLALGIDKNAYAVEWAVHNLGAGAIDEYVAGIESEKDALYEAMSAAIDIVIEELGDGNDEAKQMARDFLVEYKNSLDSASAEVIEFAQNLQAELSEIESAYSSVLDAQDKMATKLSSYGGTFTAIQEGYAELLATQQQLLSAQDKLVNSLVNYGSLYEDIDLGYVTITKLSDIQGQITDLEQYYDKLQRLRDRGISDEMLAEILEMSVEEASKYAEALLQLSDKEFDDYIDLLRKKQELAQEIADDFYKTIADGIQLSTATEDLQEQIDTLNRYEDAIDDLKKRGIDEDLLSEILEGSVDDAIAYANILLNATDEEWDEFIDLWQEKQRRSKEIAEKYYQDQLDTLTDEYDRKLREGLSELYDTSWQSGVDTAQGIIDGLASKEAEIYAKARGIADNVARIIREAWDIHSPSGVAMDLGSNFGSTLGTSIGTSFEDAMEGVQNVVSAMPSSLSISSGVSTTDRQTETLVNAIGTMMAGAGGAMPGGDAHIILEINGTQFARAIMPDFRNVNAQSPERLSIV